MPTTDETVQAVARRVGCVEAIRSPVSSAATQSDGEGHETAVIVSPIDAIFHARGPPLGRTELRM